MSFTRRSLYAVVALAAAGQLPAQAQQTARLTLEEVIVTAQKREENLQTVPVSMVVETGAALEKKGIGDLSTLSTSVPNLYIEDGGNTPNIAMRGLGSPGIESVEPSVGFYIDNISMARPRGITQNPFFDLARVEVLRGPQGTLWGRNTVVGAINVVTAAPTQELEGYVSAEAGNYNSHRGELVVSGPIVPTLAGRLSVLNSRTGNYLDNHIGPDAGGTDSESYRGQLLWEPTEGISARLKYEHTYHEQKGTLTQLVDEGPAQLANVDPVTGAVTYSPNPVTPLLRALGEDFDADLDQYNSGTGTLTISNPAFVGYVNNTRQSNSSDLVSLNVDIELPADYLFTSQTGWVDYETTRVTNDNVIALRNLGDKTEFWSQEFRLQSPEDRFFSFIGGLYVDHLDVDINPKKIQVAIIDVPRSGIALRAGDDGVPGDREKVDSWSAYFEGRFKFTEQWQATLGLRYGEEEKDFDDNGIGLQLMVGGNPLPVYILDEGGTLSAPASEKLSRDDDYLTWSAKLQYFYTPDMMFYVTAATGYKSGGFNNASSTLVIDDKSFDEETSLAFEAGAKLTFADGRGRLNAAVFRTEFDDLQVAVINQRSTVVTTNAAQAVTQGVELDGTWRLAEHWIIGGSYSYLDAYYDDFKGAPCGFVKQQNDPIGCINGQDLTDDTLQRAPEHSASAYIEYQQPIASGWELNGHLGWSFRDRTTTEVNNEVWSDVLRLVDARLELANTDSGWSVALKGNNLTDERAVIQRQASTLLGGNVLGVITTPRTYALQVKKTF